MIPSQIMRLGRRTLTALKKEGSPTESDLSKIGSDSYKPFYRSIVIVMGLFNEDKNLKRAPTMSEGIAILRSAHPWFVVALDRDLESFEALWENHYEVWWDPDVGVYVDD